MDKEVTLDDLDKDVGFTSKHLEGAQPEDEQKETQQPEENKPSEDKQHLEGERQQEEKQQPDGEQHSESEHSESEQPPEGSQQKTNNSSENINFVAMRKIKERLEKENRELMEKIRLQSEKPVDKPQQSNKQPQVDDNSYDFSEDDLIEGKHLKSVLNEVNSLKKELNQYRQQEQSSRLEMKLKAEHPDIEKVVTKENIELLCAAYPAVGESIKNDPNVYTQLSSAYTLIKNFGIGDQKAQDKTIEKNLSAPKTAKSVNTRTTALDSAHNYTKGMTEKDKEYHRKQLYHAMQYGED